MGWCVCAVLQNWNMHPGAHFQDPSSQQLECMYRIPTRRPPTKRATRTWKFAMQYKPEGGVGGGEWTAFCVYKPTHPWHSSTHIHIIIIIFINTPISTSISTRCAFHSAMIRLGWLVGWWLLPCESVIVLLSSCQGNALSLLLCHAAKIENRAALIFSLPRCVFTSIYFTNWIYRIAPNRDDEVDDEGDYDCCVENKRDGNNSGKDNAGTLTTRTQQQRALAKLRFGIHYDWKIYYISGHLHVYDWGRPLVVLHGTLLSTLRRTNGRARAISPVPVPVCQKLSVFICWCPPSISCERNKF